MFRDLTNNKIIITILLFTQLCFYIHKNLNQGDLNHNKLKIRMVAMIVLVLVEIWQQIVQMHENYQTDISSFIYLHASALLVTIVTWLLLHKRSNTRSDSLFLC